MVASRSFGSRGPRLPHLTQGKGGLPGEVNDLRGDVEAMASYLETELQPLVLEEFTNLVAASAAAIKASFPTSASPQSFSRTAGTLIALAEMVPPRNPTVTSTTHANVDAVIVTFTGRVRDENGDLIAQTATVTLTDGGGATDAAAKAFSFVDSVDFPAEGGTAGAHTIGFGTVVGLKKKIRSAAGLPLRVLQVTDGALVTNGTFVAAATATPNGTWSPNTAPDAVHDYAILYVPDLR